MPEEVSKPKYPPVEFLDPITKAIMANPVIASDGFTYDRMTIAGRHGNGQEIIRNPITNEILDIIKANTELKEIIENFLKEHADDLRDIMVEGVQTTPSMVDLTYKNRKKITYDVVFAFLSSVHNGAIDKARDMMMEYGPEIATKKGTIVDHTNNIYSHITGFQLSMALLHYEMFIMMKQLLGEKETLEQLENFDLEIMEHKIVVLEQLLLHYNNIMHQFEQKTIDEDELKQQFIEIGKLQSKLPIHFLYRFCNPDFHDTTCSHYLFSNYRERYKFYLRNILHKLKTEHTLLCFDKGDAFCASLTISVSDMPNGQVAFSALFEATEILNARTDTCKKLLTMIPIQMKLDYEALQQLLMLKDKILISIKFLLSSEEDKLPTPQPLPAQSWGEWSLSLGQWSLEKASSAVCWLWQTNKKPEYEDPFAYYGQEPTNPQNGWGWFSRLRR